MLFVKLTIGSARAVRPSRLPVGLGLVMLIRRRPRGASGDLLVPNNSREILRKVPDEIARVILSTEDERRLSPP